MILIWANFNAQLFIHRKLSMKCLELFFYVSTCSQQRCAAADLVRVQTKFEFGIRAQLFLSFMVDVHQDMNTNRCINQTFS